MHARTHVRAHHSNPLLHARERYRYHTDDGSSTRVPMSRRRTRQITAWHGRAHLYRPTEPLQMLTEGVQHRLVCLFHQNHSSKHGGERVVVVVVGVDMSVLRQRGRGGGVGGQQQNPPYVQ